MRYLFGDGIVLDEERREVRRGGGLVPVEPQVFDLLLCLLHHRGRVVSRDELLEAVWNGRIVSESTMDSRINVARRAIGDSGKEQRLIRTLPRRGARFVGEARQESGETAVPRTAEPPGYEDVVGALGEPAPRQEVAFIRAADGVNLAVASAGESPSVLVKTANWLNHLEHDWRSPVWSPLLRRLAAGRRLVRYDGRGNGLSDRNVPDYRTSRLWWTVSDLSASTCSASRKAPPSRSLTPRHIQSAYRASCFMVRLLRGAGGAARKPSASWHRRSWR